MKLERKLSAAIREAVESVIRNEEGPDLRCVFDPEQPLCIIVDTTLRDIRAEIARRRSQLLEPDGID